jgi:hypothetical protein
MVMDWFVILTWNSGESSGIASLSRRFVAVIIMERHVILTPYLACLPKIHKMPSKKKKKTICKK